MNDRSGTEKKSVIRETDEAAREQARTLIRSARHAALAVIDPDTTFPSVSRALVATDHLGRPVVLVSALSSHTKALAADGRASLLFGEPGKGDPLAHPRITVQCRASKIDRESEERVLLRQRFLARHPKSELYIDFPDFSFFRLTPTTASLNGGFGKAFNLTGPELTIDHPASAALASMEAGAVEHMNDDHTDAIALYATVLAGQEEGQWRMATVDVEGFEIAKGDKLVRIPFQPPLNDAGDLRKALVDLVKRARSHPSDAEGELIQPQ